MLEGALGLRAPETCDGNVHFSETVGLFPKTRLHQIAHSGHDSLVSIAGQYFLPGHGPRVSCIPACIHGLHAMRQTVTRITCGLSSLIACISKQSVSGARHSVGERTMAMGSSRPDRCFGVRSDDRTKLGNWPPPLDPVRPDQARRRCSDMRDDSPSAECGATALQ